MGSVVKSAGSLVGGLLGGAGGAVTGGLLGELGPKYTDTDALQNIANQQLAGAQDAQAQLSGLANQRSQFGQALANQALGQAPSISEAQLKQAMDKNLSQQIAAARSNRSVNPALASRMNVQQANQAAQQTAQQASINRLAEQQANQQAFGNYLAQQQQAGAQFLGGAGQSQSGVMNTQFANQQRGINTFSGLAQAGASAAALMSDKNLKTKIKKYNKGGYVEPKKMANGGLVKDVAGGYAVENMQDSMANGQNMQQMGTDFGTLLSKLGQAQPMALDAGQVSAMPSPMLAQVPMMASKGAVVPGKAKVAGDSEANDTVPALLSPGEVVVPRTVVDKGEKAVSEFVKQALMKKQGRTSKVQKKSEGGKVDAYSPQAFLDSLKAYSYEYKDGAEGPGVSPGRKLGVMAQDLEKSPIGQQMVKQTPNGKQIDLSQSFGAVLASQAHLNERLKALESKYGKKG